MVELKARNRSFSRQSTPVSGKMFPQSNNLLKSKIDWFTADSGATFLKSFIWLAHILRKDVSRPGHSSKLGVEVELQGADVEPWLLTFENLVV
jgi:hypothetical protein